MRVSRFCVLGVAAVAACAAPPMGPLVQVLPGPNKSFARFQDEDMSCRGFANGAVAGQAEAANQTAVGSAVLGTVLGAGLGAAIGGGRGAAVGAATGAGFGTSIGVSGSGGAQMGIQMQYDSAYAQCMYARGNQVPGYAPQPVAYAPASPQTSLVQAVQIELNRLGYMRGPADGLPGPQTVGGIQNFEASHGLPVDGVASPYLLDQMRQTPTGY